MLSLDNCLGANRPLIFVTAESDLELLSYIKDTYIKDEWVVYSSTLARLVPLSTLINSKFKLKEERGMSDTEVFDNILKRHFDANSNQFVKFIFLEAEMLINDKQNIRKIKDIISRYQLDENFTVSLIFVSQTICVPLQLERLSELVFFDLPDDNKIIDVSDEVSKKLELKKDQKPNIEILHNLKGLTCFEIEQSYLQSYHLYKKIELKFIRDFKKNSIAKTDLLSLMETDVTFNDIGGMEKLKAWIKKSAGGWTVEGKKFGLPLLKGSLLVGLPGCGKAQPLDSIIYTPVGPKLMGDIKKGDVVCTPEGTAKVLYVAPQGKKDIYQISFRDGSIVECCDDHLWEIKIRDKRHQGTKHILPLKDFPSLVSKYDNKTSNVSIRVPDFAYFEEKDVTIDPYILGLFIGNGALGNEDDPKCRVIGFSSQEESLIRKIKKELKKFDCTLECKKDSIEYTVNRIKGTGKRNKFKTQLEKYGLLGKKSVNKHIPIDYLFNSYENRIKLLNGLMDTDGNVVQNGHGSEYSTSSEKLATDFKLLIESLGGVCKVTSRESSYVKRNKIFKCGTSYRCWPKVVFNPFSLKRKRNNYIIRTKYKNIYRFVEKVKYVGKKEAQCIALDDNDKLYLTNDFIITHNSLAMKAIGNEWGLPVVSFDPSRLFSSRIGDSESNMRRVLQIVENMAPCILAIDEIEKGFAGIQSSTFSDAGVTARVIGSFLIWMQDSTAPVFVIATANNIQYLPPELINRFDETFFVNLPQHLEREDIFKIHLKKLNRNPDDFDIGNMALLSENVSGREIEQTLRESMYDAFSKSQELTTDHITDVLHKKTNLLTTMAEQLNYLLKWVGWDDEKKDGIRARFASIADSFNWGEVRSQIDDIIKDIEGANPGTDEQV